MANLKLSKLTTLPGSLEANHIYLVKAGGSTYGDLIVADSAGNGVEFVSDARINSLIMAASNPEVQLYADIAARDAATLTANSIVLVTDASADATVASGAAMYFYDNTGSTFTKVTEFESLDVVLDWNNLINGPSSTAAQIDATVAQTSANTTAISAINTAQGVQDGLISGNTSNITTNTAAIALNTADRHTHANKTELDKITENGLGEMLYNGEFPMYYVATGW